MKEKIKKILITPKLATALALGVAVIAGVSYSVIQNNTRANRFAEIVQDAPSTSVVAGVSPQQHLTLAFPVGGRIKSVSVKIGDAVKAGDVLASLDSENALGAVNQAKAAYAAAQTAYQKLVNGASTPDIDVAKVALNNAKNAYAVAADQQKVAVTNALSTMLNSGLVALPTTNGASTSDTPVISGTYADTDQGTYTITSYETGNGGYFSFSGLENGTGPVSTVAVPLGTRGLYIQFPSNTISNANTMWTVSIPNTQSPAYLSNYNAYQSALENQSQAVAGAQAAIDTAQAALDQKLAGARSEDLDIAKAQVESTQGALQIAQGAYDNTLITAPADGTITNVTITAGQVALPNTPAIELLSK